MPILSMWSIFCGVQKLLSASRGFFGNHQFSQANAYLESYGKTPIDWRLPAQVDPSELNF